MKEKIASAILLFVFLTSAIPPQSGGGRDEIETWVLEDGAQKALEPISPKPAKVRVGNLGPGHIMVYVVTEKNGNFTKKEMTAGDKPKYFL